MRWWRGDSGAVVAALLVVVIWGTNFVFVKAAFREFELGTFLFLRYAGMIVLAWAVVAVVHRHREATPIFIRREDCPRVLLSGLLGFSIYISLSMIGLHYTTAFSNALLLATAPLFAVLLLWRSRQETTGAAQLPGMLLAFAGVALFLSEKVNGGAGIASLGDLISLASAFFFAAYTVVNTPLLKRYPARIVTAWTLSIGALPVLLVSAPALWTQAWSDVTMLGWSVMLWSIVLPIYVAWTVWAWVSHRDGVGRTSLFIYLVPIVGGITAWLLLGEGFGPQKIAGATLTLTGLLIARHWSPVRRASAIPTSSSTD